MDKKNTMLLTVIAVATLLVAVVGATFAYFSVSGSGTATASITTTADKVGTVTVAQGTDNLQITLTATDMAKLGKDQTYYATVSGSENHNDSETKYDLAKLTLSGSEEKTKYTCTGNVTVTLEAQNKAGAQGPAVLPEFKTGDGKLHLEGPKGLDGNGQTSIDIDLKTLKDGSNTKVINNVTFALDGKTNMTASLKGYLAITNSNTENQDHLIDKAFKVSVKLDITECTIDQTALEG